MGGTPAYLAQAARMAGRLERAAVLDGRAFTILRNIGDRSGQMLAAEGLISTLRVLNNGNVRAAPIAFVCATAREIGDPRPQVYEPLIRNTVPDFDAVPLDVLIEESATKTLAIFEHYEQILHDCGEDPYSPLEPA
jgi:hypothetical protein